MKGIFLKEEEGGGCGHGDGPSSTERHLGVTEDPCNYTLDILLTPTTFYTF